MKEMLSKDLKQEKFSFGDRRVLYNLQEDIYYHLVEELDEGLAVLGQEGFEYCNSAFIKLLDLSQDEIHARGAEIVWQKLPPDKREEVKEWLSCRKDDHSIQPPLSLRLKIENGRILTLKLSRAGADHEKFIILIRDMTEAVEFRLRFEEKERILSSLINEASTPVFIVQNGKIIFANKVIREVFGYQPEEVIGSRIDSYLTEDEKDEIMNLYWQRFIIKPFRKKVEVKIKHRDGHPVDVAFEANMVTYDGVPSEIVIMHDISELKKVQALQQAALEKIRMAFGATINVLNRLIEFKDPNTGGHQKRLAELTRIIAVEMELPPERIDGLSLAAQIHDIGKIIVPSEILSKPGKLNPSEMALIRNHVQIAYDLLKEVEFPWPVAEIIYQHHERLDGSGYPRGLRDNQIMLEARILAVADVVEAMVSHRPYREAYSLEETLAELEKNKGILYDEKVVEVTVKLFREKAYNFKFNRQ